MSHSVNTAISQVQEGTANQNSGGPTRAHLRVFNINVVLLASSFTLMRVATVLLFFFSLLGGGLLF